MDGFLQDCRCACSCGSRLATQDDARFSHKLYRALSVQLLTLIIFFALGISIRPLMAQNESNDKDITARKQDTDSGEEHQDSEITRLTLRGRCIDFVDKKPIPGAVVRMYEIKGYTRPVVEILNTVTDDKGEFEFADMIRPQTNHPTDRMFYLLLAEADNRPIGYGGSWTLNESDPTFREISFQRESGRVSGTIMNARGEPVPGANISQWSYDGRPLPGILSDITDAEGKFEIDRIPDFKRFGTSFTVSHPDYPVKELRDIKVPATLSITLKDGCKVSGVARDASTGKPSRLTVIVAGNHKTHEETTTVTDSDGRFHFVLNEGRYTFQAKRKGRVSKAIADQDCVAGERMELPAFDVITGGQISGRVINTANGEVVTLGNSAQPITIGLFGPSHPNGRVRAPTAEAQVDSSGRYSLRAVPGENYPYFVNVQGDRMSWTTMEHPAVIVRENEITNYDMLITPPVPTEEKLKDAKKLVEGLSKDPKERTAQILVEFRKLSHTVDETELWCTLMRELVTIGKDAVPQLCTELDETDQDKTIRRLAFALRAIGDPRAVPVLIRALPKTLLPPASDYGLVVADDELTVFMQKNSLPAKIGGTHFDFSRAVREVGGALKSLTGQELQDDVALNLFLSDDPRRQILQRRIMLAAAKPWQSWWEDHWRDFINDVAYSRVNLDIREQPLPPAPETLGLTAHLGESESEGATLSPASEKAKYATQFEDLDTGFSPTWPADIPRDEAEFKNQRMMTWIQNNGVDLACVTYQSPDGTNTFVLKSFGMKVWEITPRELRNLDKLLAAGKLPEGHAVDDLLMHYDAETAKYVPEANAAFIYVTKEGSMGVIEVTDRVTQTRNLVGPFAPPEGTGFHKGVRFNLKTIVP